MGLNDRNPDAPDWWPDGNGGHRYRSPLPAPKNWPFRSDQPILTLSRWYRLKRWVFWAQYDLRSWLSDWIAP